MTPHTWTRWEEKDWKPIDRRPTTATGHALPQKPRPSDGWVYVMFECEECDSVGRAAHTEGRPVPEHPEEAQNYTTRQVIDPYGDCIEQLVGGVHGI